MRILLKIIEVEPLPKPRMTQRDKWAKRHCVNKYFLFRDQVRLATQNFLLPSFGIHVIFFIRTKTKKLWGKPHQKRPDKDNLEKALLDALFTEDAHIFTGLVSKVWAEKGRIEIWVDSRIKEVEDEIYS